jgi:hypothetical protein
MNDEAAVHGRSASSIELSSHHASTGKGTQRLYLPADLWDVWVSIVDAVEETAK